MLVSPRATAAFGFCIPPQELLKHPRHQDKIVRDELSLGAIVLTLDSEAEEIWPYTIYKALRGSQSGGQGGAGFLVCTNATPESMKVPDEKVLEKLKECLNLEKDVQPQWFKL